MKKLYVVLLVLLVVTILACDNDSKQTTCTCAETEYDAACACGADICNCTVILEPAERNFQITGLDFLNPDEPEMRYSIAVQDARTNLGSAATLEDLGIVDQIETTIMSAFDSVSGALGGQNRASVLSQTYSNILFCNYVYNCRRKPGNIYTFNNITLHFCYY